MDSTPLNISEQEYTRIAQHDPDLALRLTQAVFQLRAGNDDQHSAVSDQAGDGQFLDAWAPFENLDDALKERPPTPYLVEQLLPLPSVAMIYGIAGSLKSLLLMDLALCVASGQPWLTSPPLPPPLGGGLGRGSSAGLGRGSSAGLGRGSSAGSGSGSAGPYSGPAGFATIKGNVFWLDLDQGDALMAERLAALARARGITSHDAALIWKTFPSGGFNLLDKRHVAEMALRLKHNDIQLLCIDNLGVAKGPADENTGEMIPVLGALRWLSEQAGAVVVLLHHARKDHGFRTTTSDLARGHTSISAGLDLALGIERDGQAEDILIRPTKCRRSVIQAFAARFSFERRPGSVDLHTARFWRQADLPDASRSSRSQSRSQAASRLPLLAEIDQAALQALEQGRLGRGALVDAVRRTFPRATIHKVRLRLDELVEQGRLVMKKGANNTSWFSLPSQAGELPLG